MKNIFKNKYFSFLLIIIGIILIIGGILTGKYGAMVIGIILVGVNSYYLFLGAGKNEI